MNVLVLGASGGIGAAIVRHAAAAGHTVTAMARTPQAVPHGVRLVVDDPLRDGAIDAALAGQEAVLSGLGLRRKYQPNPWSPIASPPDLCERTARTLVEAMPRHGLTGLRDGDGTGRITSTTTFPFGAWIARSEVARWMVEHLAADLSGDRTPGITEQK